MKRILIIIFTIFLIFNLLSLDVFSKEKLTKEEIVDIALKYEGYRYVYGGASPKGFDCSGFVYYVYFLAGYSISRTSSGQYNDGCHINFEDLEIGDILLFKNTYKSGISHSGIYIGNNKFIHAENHKSGVIITSLYDNYYKSRFVTGIRVICESYKNNDTNLFLVKKIEKAIKFNIEILMK